MTPKREIQSKSAPSAIGPYSQGIRAGNLIFCSGQIPLDPTTGTLISGGVEKQTQQVMKNLQAVLEAANASLNDVVKTTIFLKDMNDFTVVNEVYGSYFQKPYPARATVQVSRLPKDVDVEIECIANVLS